jgi:hypothetical protein
VIHKIVVMSVVLVVVGLTVRQNALIENVYLTNARAARLEGVVTKREHAHALLHDILLADLQVVS